MTELKVIGNEVKVVGDETSQLYFHGHHVSIASGDTITAFPSGHHYENPTVISPGGEVIQDNPQHRGWLTQPFISSFLKQNRTAAKLETIPRKSPPSESVLIVNCLDSCYGHAFYKLLNVARYEQTAHHLVVIIHPNLTHFVPEYVDEIWQIEVPFSHQDDHLVGFHEFVTEQLRRYAKAYLAQTIMALDMGQVDLEDFTKVPPFDFLQFAKGGPFEICLLLRTDRFWLTSSFDQWLFLVWKKTKFFIIQKYLMLRERSNYRKLIKFVNQKTPANWTAVGIGKGAPYSFVNDLRMEYSAFTQNEESWCERYALSHMSIGVHGSNMLVPSYLSGAYVSLIPPFKIVNYSEDFLPRKEPVQRTLFTARNLSTSTKPKELALHVLSVLQGYKHGLKQDL